MISYAETSPCFGFALAGTITGTTLGCICGYGFGLDCASILCVCGIGAFEGTKVGADIYREITHEISLFVKHTNDL